MIELRNVTKKFGNSVILENVNANIERGDVIAIIGPSGTGKSTLLNCINLLSPPTSGQVFLDGVELTSPDCNLNEQRKKMGMVFQQFNLFNHWTVLENVIKPQMDLLGTDKQTACDKAMEYLRLVGMADRKFKYADSLSGGQKQRVAIARTLAMEPEIILLDEPTSALDPTMVGEVEYVIKRLAKMGKTMIIVTHEMRFAREVSNRIFYMDERHIYEDAKTEDLFTNPRTDKARRFINRLKYYELAITSPDSDFGCLRSQIEQFCDKADISRKLTQRAQLLFEEMCVQNLMNEASEANPISVSLEYSEESEKLAITITHGGRPVLEREGLDEISRSLIESVMNEIEVKEIIR